MFQSIFSLFGASRFTLTSVDSIEQYKCGQVWNYKTRSSESNSRVTITRIDKDKQGEVIFHVFLDQLQLKNPHHPDGMIFELPHTPLTINALNKSVKKLSETTPDLPNYEQGYEAWLNAWHQGQANIFSQPIKEIIDFVERSLKAGS